MNFGDKFHFENGDDGRDTKVSNNGMGRTGEEKVQICLDLAVLAMWKRRFPCNDLTIIALAHKQKGTNGRYIYHQL